MLDKAEKIIADLNEQQVEAVTTGPGPVILIAGAGSGKTLEMGIKKGFLTEKDYNFDFQSNTKEWVAKCRFCDKVVNQEGRDIMDFEETYQRNVAGMRKHLAECPWNHVGVDTTLLEEYLQKYISEGKISNEQAEIMLTEYSNAVLMEAVIQYNFFIREAQEMMNE